MNLIVLLKPVIDFSNSRVSRSQSRIIENGQRIMNMSDRNALEIALSIKDKIKETTIHAISMGGQDALSILREVLAVGADKAYHLSDSAFDGGDALSITYRQ